MEKYVKQNNFQKHIQILLVKMNLALKENKEYKINLFSVLLFDIITFFVFYIFLTIYIEKVLDGILDWNKYDFIVYYILLLVAGKTVRMFVLHSFNLTLIKGLLNLILVRPMNTFFFSSLKIMNGAGVLTTPITILILFFLVYFGNYTNIFLFYGFLLFSIFYYILFYNFFQVLAFFMKGENYLFDFVQTKINFSVEEFTPKLFHNSSFNYIVFLIPSALYGFFSLELLKGNYDLLLFYLPYIVISFIFLLLSIIILWHYGLKKYEAFG